MSDSTNEEATEPQKLQLSGMTLTQLGEQVGFYAALDNMGAILAWESRVAARIQQIRDERDEAWRKLLAMHEEPALKQAEAEAAKLRGALFQAAHWFDEYAESHEERGCTKKAQRNADRAQACRDAARKGGA